MKIHNVRLGFANNSSSTHSLVFFGDRHKFLKDDGVEHAEFGWDFFTAASTAASSPLMILSKIKLLLNRLRKPSIDDAIEDLKQNYADAVYQVDHDISRGENGEIIITPKVTRIK